MPANPPVIPHARLAVLEALGLVLVQGEGLQEALDRVLTRRFLSSEDRGLVTEVVYGTLRHKGRIDFLLSMFLNRSKSLPGAVRLTLTAAAYEILFLDRVPAYASVNWAVDQVKLRLAERYAGVVNAVLRRISELGPEVREEAFYAQDRPEPAVLGSRFFSCPEWLVRLWLGVYGESRTRCYLAASLEAPPVGLRFNPTREAVATLGAAWAIRPDVIMGEGWRSSLGQTPEDLTRAEAQGLVSRQSAAAQEAVLAFAPQDWQGPVWDACAGRGGKACLLAEKGVTPVWASDVHLGRLKGLKRELARLGLEGVQVLSAAADRPVPFRRSPRTILLDVPCTGLGVLSRRPDIKWKRTPGDVRRLAALQARILENAWQNLDRGGLLVYLTCTLSPEENEGQLRRFLAAHPRVKPERGFSTPPDSKLREFFWGFSVRKG